MADSDVLMAVRKRIVNAKSVAREAAGPFAQGAFHTCRLVLEWIDEEEAKAAEAEGEHHVEQQEKEQHVSSSPKAGAPSGTNGGRTGRSGASARPRSSPAKKKVRTSR